MMVQNRGRRTQLVLVAEDNEEAYELYSEYLASVGFAVEGSSDGIEALERAAELRPDLVLLDLSLPRLNGIEVARRLRLDPRTRAIPILAVSGLWRRRLPEVARRAGCDAFLAKPCTLAQLEAEARRLLDADPSAPR
jgi:CheY-like chemotaxis protein